MGVKNGQAQKKLFIPQRGEWFHLEAGTTFYYPQDDALVQNPGFSISFAFLGESRFGISHWSLAYGLGFGSYSFNNNLYIGKDSATEQTYFSFIDKDAYASKDVVQRSRQTFQYIEVPLELRYRSRTNKKGRYFRLYPFAKVGVRVRSFSLYTKNDYSVAYFGIPNINYFRTVAGFRIGYHFWSIYASYELTPTYRNQVIDGVALEDFRSLTAGLSISF